jgi:hypothetical protein
MMREITVMAQKLSSHTNMTDHPHFYWEEWGAID